MHNKKSATKSPKCSIIVSVRIGEPDRFCRNDFAASKNESDSCFCFSTFLRFRCRSIRKDVILTDELNNHTERAHSPLGASSCSRWWNCPGSVQLSKGFHGRSSVFAREGTAAHELSEMCLHQNRDAHEFLGIQIEVEGDKWQQEMPKSCGLSNYWQDRRL